MGRCSATDVFDPMVEYILNLDVLAPAEKVRMIAKLIDVLENYDWDCQSSSRFWRHEYVQIAQRQLHPDEYTDEYDDITLATDAESEDV